MVEGSVQVAALALAAPAADLVELALNMVVTEGACADVHCIPAKGAVLHVPYTSLPCPFTSFSLPLHRLSHRPAFPAHTQPFHGAYIGILCSYNHMSLPNKSQRHYTSLSHIILNGVHLKTTKKKIGE